MNVEMESKKISWKVTISILLAVLTVFITYFCIVVFSIWPIDEVSIQNIGMLGDSFGLLTSLFSGLALGAAIYLLYVQKSEFNNIRRHSLMMARIERANFQPRFDVSGKYTTLGVTKNENTITITSKHAGDHERFFIFKQVEIIFDNKTYTKDDDLFVVRNQLEGVVILALMKPIEKSFYMTILYQDLSGYISSMKVAVICNSHKNNSNDRDYKMSAVANLEMTSKLGDEL